MTTPTETRELLPGLRALADEARLSIAALVDEGAFNVGELQNVLGLGQSTVSRHLKILSDAGLLSVQREGRIAWYQWSPVLSGPQESLRGLVRAHARGFDAGMRQRLRGVFEARAEQTRRFFAGPAGEAAAAGRASFPNVDVVDALVAQLPKGGTVVDVGTGAGRLLPALRRRAERVVGVDASPRMLELAQRRVREAGLDGVSLRLGELEHLPFADGEADAVVAHLVLHHVSQPEAALAELRRVLRPGGVLLVADYLPHARESMRQQFADFWLGFEPVKVSRMLREAGFVDASVDRHEGDGEVLGMFVASGFRSEGRETRAGSKTVEAPGGTGSRRRQVRRIAGGGRSAATVPGKRATVRAETKR